MFNPIDRTEEKHRDELVAVFMMGAVFGAAVALGVMFAVGVI